MWSLVVFSHLRWDFVFQRPQQLMTRFAKKRRVLFIEEPVFDSKSTFIEVNDPCSSVRVLRPHTPVRAPGFCDEQMPLLRTLIEDSLTQSVGGDHVGWLYTPMAAPLLTTLKPQAVVYDCMDELSVFRNAPSQLKKRELDLMETADLVFTGGASLYAAKRSLHPSVHCFPSAVDAAHFAQGREGNPVHPSLRDVGRPRLGFFGVIDERLDLGLVAEVAAARPAWQLCFVGPVAKIDPTDLPQRPNIHYFGQQAYDQLPAFLAGWDVCLLPFALNDATRYISPTKTLEYMAAERPIVSTPIRDVSDSYAAVVRIASRSDFVTACEEALAESPDPSETRRVEMRRIVGQSSWDRTAEAMEALIDITVRSAHRSRASRPEIQSA